MYRITINFSVYLYCMQLKNMIAALYSSQPNGTKNFMKNDTYFGWNTVVKIYNADLYRAKNGNTR